MLLKFTPEMGTRLIKASELQQFSFVSSDDLVWNEADKYLLDVPDDVGAYLLGADNRFVEVPLALVSTVEDAAAPRKASASKKSDAQAI